MFFKKKINYIFFILLLALFYSCGNKSHNFDFVKIKYNEEIVDSLMKKHGSNIAIMSCLRCRCFVDEYNQQYLVNKKNPSGYVLLSDPNCNQFAFPVDSISNIIVENISEDFYNLVFLKKRNNNFSVYIVSVKEAEKIESVAARFFK